MADVVFANGIVFKLPRSGAPDFVKGSLSFKVDDAIKFLQEYKSDNGWCNVDLKVSKAGKSYAELNTWKPNNGDYTSSAKSVNSAYQDRAKKAIKDMPDDIPF